MGFGRLGGGPEVDGAPTVAHCQIIAGPLDCLPGQGHWAGGRGSEAEEGCAETGEAGASTTARAPSAPCGRPPPWALSRGGGAEGPTAGLRRAGLAIGVGHRCSVSGQSSGCRIAVGDDLLAVATQLGAGSVSNLRVMEPGHPPPPPPEQATSIPQPLGRPLHRSPWSSRAGGWAGNQEQGGGSRDALEGGEVLPLPPPPGRPAFCPPSGKCWLQWHL